MSDADKKRMSIELPAIVTFHMPCRTKVENNPTTFSVAIGKNMAVNLIIGMAFIRSTKMVMDFDDGVVEAKALATKPLELVYRCPQRGLPRNIPMDESSNNTLYVAMKARIVLTYKLFMYEDDILIVPQFHADKKPKGKAYSADTDDHGSTIVRSNVNDGMSSVLR